MPTVNFSKKRKQLTAALGAVLSVSALLIAMERTGIIRRPEAGRDDKKASGAVRGESVVVDPALASYRQSAGAAFTQIEENIVQLAKSEPLDQESLSRLRADLLSTIVPAPYQDLHLRLASLVVNLLDKQKQDGDFLREQSRRLLKDYPWLPTSNQDENSQ